VCHIVVGGVFLCDDIPLISSAARSIAGAPPVVLLTTDTDVIDACMQQQGGGGLFCVYGSVSQPGDLRLVGVESALRVVILSTFMRGVLPVEVDRLSVVGARVVETIAPRERGAPVVELCSVESIRFLEGADGVTKDLRLMPRVYGGEAVCGSHLLSKMFGLMHHSPTLGLLIDEVLSGACGTGIACADAKELMAGKEAATFGDMFNTAIEQGAGVPVGIWRKNKGGMSTSRFLWYAPTPHADVGPEDVIVMVSFNRIE
jgi:hypothetical protein